MNTSNSTADVTVLLPVYNAKSYIADAVHSILQQTYRNFELLIIDDGSTDGSGEILKKLSTVDSRIRLYQHENRGLIATLNEGLQLCRTELVARMDADDIALPTRLEKQREFLLQHERVAVCGTAMQFLETGTIRAAMHGEPQSIELLFHNTVYHPTVMYRRSIILQVGGYSTAFPCAEDYGLWVTLAQAGYAIDNLPEVLLKYRMHLGQPRTQYRIVMRHSTDYIWTCQLKRMGITPSTRDLLSHGYCAYFYPTIPAHNKAARLWLQKLLLANEQAGIYPQQDFEQFIRERIDKLPPPLRITRNPLHYLGRMCCYYGRQIFMQLPKRDKLERFFMRIIWFLRSKFL